MKIIIQEFSQVCISFGVKKINNLEYQFIIKNYKNYSKFNLLNSFAINSPIILDPTGSVCIPS